jgi:hypothetical protein
MAGVPAFVKQRYEEAVPLGRLTPHPANPNQGDQGLLCELLDANGFAGAVLAQESTGILIDGETRWRVAQLTDMRTLPVIWCDVDDDTRDRLLAEYNESGRRGANNESKLVALLQGLAVTPRGLAGAAFDGDDLDDLVARLTPPERDGDGSPPGGGRPAGGELTEITLVFTVEDRAELGRLLEDARGALGDPEARAADLLLQSMRAWKPAAWPAAGVLRSGEKERPGGLGPRAAPSAPACLLRQGRRAPRNAGCQS